MEKLKNTIENTNLLSINQLVDRINELKQDMMTEQLGIYRQNLINLRKLWGINSGCLPVSNSQRILQLIEKVKNAQDECLR